MKQNKKWLLCGLLVVAICAGAAVAFRSWQARSRVDSVTALVRAHLNDPESARFERVTFNPATGGGCGYVNAKNRMGGYVGFTFFIATPGGPVLFEPDSDDKYGSAQDRLKKLQDHIAFLDEAKEKCVPDEPEPNAASSPAK